MTNFSLSVKNGLLIFSLCLAAACSKKEETTDYKYDYTCNGCSTGSQSFTSHGDYCATLLNESANNSCCRNEREQTYNAQCK